MGPKEARELCPHLVVVHTATYRPGELESGYWEDANVETHKVSSVMIAQMQSIDAEGCVRLVWIHIEGRVQKSWQYSGRWYPKESFVSDHNNCLFRVELIISRESKYRRSLY
jgi:hypothetical protein